MPTRQPGSKPPAQSNKSAPSWGFKGAAAISQQYEIEKDVRERRQNNNENKRFWLPKGSECELIILDSSVDDLFALHEYELIPQGKTFREKYHETSMETLQQECPLKGYIDGSGKAQYPALVTFATVLVLQEYTNSKGDKVPYSRKLLPMKNTQGPEFMRRFTACEKKIGTLRGFHFRVVRDDDDLAPRIGKPDTLDTLEYGYWTDEELIAEFGHPAIMSEKDNKVIVQENGLLEPFDYYKLFKKPDEQQLRRTYRIGGVMGSRQEEQEIWDGAVESDLSESPETQPEQEQPAKKAAPKAKVQKQQTVMESLTSEDLLTEDDIPF